MEYRLNKIDTDIRAEINRQTKEGKVHTKKGIKISSDKSKDHNQSKGHQKKEEKEGFDLSKYNNKDSKTIQVKAYKGTNVEVEAEKEEDSGEDSYRGRFIDIRR
jgi:hypothetical protein